MICAGSRRSHARGMSRAKGTGELNMRNLAATAIALASALGFAAPATSFADDLSHPFYANKKDARSLTAYGEKLIADDHCTAAIPFLQMAVEVDPSYAEAYLDL